MANLAAGRERRVTAGNRMNRLLEDEQEDEFYKTTYGGFEEAEDDQGFKFEDENQAESSSDSDISDSEDDEPISDDDDDDGKKRKRRVVTKAYREPVKEKPQRKPAPSKSSSTADKTKEKRKEPPIETDDFGTVRKSARRSTVQRVNEYQIRIKQREEQSKIMKAAMAKKPGTEVRRLTQAELLKEAKTTEKKNLASLKVYQQMEAEKKKVKTTKPVYKGPIIRFLSTTMPVIEEIKKEVVVNVDRLDGSALEEVKRVKTKQRCSRNFITISDVKLFPEHFPKKAGRPPTKLYCPVTRMPAKYIDPITSIPYATKKAFKIIREAYAAEIENAMINQRKKSGKSSRS